MKVFLIASGVFICEPGGDKKGDYSIIKLRLLSSFSGYALIPGDPGQYFPHKVLIPRIHNTTITIIDEEE